MLFKAQNYDHDSKMDTLSRSLNYRYLQQLHAVHDLRNEEIKHICAVYMYSISMSGTLSVAQI